MRHTLTAALRACILIAVALPAAIYTIAIAGAVGLDQVARSAARRAHDALFAYMGRAGLALGAAQLIPLQPFTNVVPAGIAISDLSNLFGYTVERLILQLGGTALTKAMLTGLQLKANGKVIFDSTGVATDAREQYRGITANANFLTIDFLELKARSKLGLMGGAIDTTLGIKNLRLEVTIAGATAPTLAGWAEVSIPQTSKEYQNVRPLIARVHRNTMTIGGAGTFLLAVPHIDPNQGGSIFKRIAVFSANITGARVERSGIREWDVSVAAMNSFNQGEYGRVPQASLFVIDFVVDGLQEDRVLDTRPAAGCNIAACYGTFSAAETITIESEVLEPLDVY